MAAYGVASRLALEHTRHVLLYSNPDHGSSSELVGYSFSRGAHEAAEQAPSFVHPCLSLDVVALGLACGNIPENYGKLCPL